MRRTAQVVQVGRRRIELSNLKKVLFPADNTIKAELIEYYIKVAPTVLAHVKGRPLSLVRFPDGIEGERFFQKNRPEWAPEWIEHVVLGSAEKKEEVDYIIATEEASLVWLANLACIELHQMHCREPHFDEPDYFVFDLDPPDNYPFRDVAKIAFDLKEHVEDFGYHPFVKTTGGKGFHILVPIEPRWAFNEVFEAAKDIATPFVEKHGSRTTLNIRKEARGGKVLIDVYRNRTYQSIVSAYSVRGLPGAPVSMPLPWDQLKDLKTADDFNLHTVPEHVVKNGDAWEGIAAYAASLHTKRKKTRKARARGSLNTKAVPATLGKYAEKRSFKKTPEPPPAVVSGEGNAFVLHRHHATRLHYDLRLEQDGVLKSWAVPKGVPPRRGIVRLAVATEDHPFEYINFEGKIPKGEYGAGEVWVYARGKYEMTKTKKDGFHFRLESRELAAEYSIHKTRDSNWMLQRVDTPQVDWLRVSVEPMLAQIAEKPPVQGNYVYEVKWDGVRAIIALDEGGMRISSRNLIDITERFPELLVPGRAFRATSAIFDAEIVCLDAEGRSVFGNVIRRMKQTGKVAIERARARYPAVCYVFDCLYLDGRPIMNEPLVRRRAWMEDAIKSGTPYRVSEAVMDGVGLFEAGRKLGLEGIMAKEAESIYQPGKRSASWLKIKYRRTMECLIIGYTEGRGSREPLFGALQLAVREGKGLRYMGKVGTGFDERSMKEVAARLKTLKRIERPIVERPADDARTVWVEPAVTCEVQYASLTEDGILREPAFLRLRPDLDA